MPSPGTGLALGMAKKFNDKPTEASIKKMGGPTSGSKPAPPKDDEDFRPRVPTMGISPRPLKNSSASYQPLASPSSFKNGGVVKKSGMAKVHKGETIVPSRASSSMGGAKKKSSKPKSKGKGKGKKGVHEMHIRHSANGGYIAKHILKDAMGGAGMQDPQEHTLGDMDELTQHVQDNMGAPPAPMPAPMMQQGPTRGGM